MLIWEQRATHGQSGAGLSRERVVCFVMWVSTRSGARCTILFRISHRGSLPTMIWVPILNAHAVSTFSGDQTRDRISRFILENGLLVPITILPGNVLAVAVRRPWSVGRIPTRGPPSLSSHRPVAAEIPVTYVVLYASRKGGTTPYMCCR